MERKIQKYLWGIVLAALLVRILCALPALCQGKPLLRIDSQTYLQPAKALLSDGAYLTAPGSGLPMTKRPPGYSLVLALLLASMV